MEISRKSGVLALLLLASPLAFSHHSAAGIDQKGSVTVTGLNSAFIILKVSLILHRQIRQVMTWNMSLQGLHRSTRLQVYSVA